MASCTVARKEALWNMENADVATIGLNISHKQYEPRMVTHMGKKLNKLLLFSLSRVCTCAASYVMVLVSVCTMGTSLVAISVFWAANVSDIVTISVFTTGGWGGSRERSEEWGEGRELIY